jgi:flagellar basal body-associated protein FliL
LIFQSGLVTGDPPQTSKEHSEGKMSTLTLIVLISLIELFVLSSATIVCIYLWRRKIARRQGNCFSKNVRL